MGASSGGNNLLLTTMLPIVKMLSVLNMVNDGNKQINKALSY